jgi:small subunit ribosomal protein S6
LPQIYDSGVQNATQEIEGELWQIKAVCYNQCTLQSGGFTVPSYELVFIFKPELTEDDFAKSLGKVNDLISKLGGIVNDTNQWGKRKLAYPIKRQIEGNYVLEKVQIKQAALKELDAGLKLMEDVLRYLFIRE